MPNRCTEAGACACTLGSSALDASGESDDVLVAARIAADQLARGLGLAPIATAAAEPGLDALLQKVESATLNDRLDDARALLAQATAAQRESPEVRLRLAHIDYQAGNLPAAEAAFAAIAKEVPAEQDPVLHARALTDLGVLSALRNDNTTAASRFDEAIALLRGRAAPDALGKALNGRANVAGAMDQAELALQAFAEARGAFERSGNLLALALVDSNLAALDMRRERYAEALPVFQRAAERFATFGMHAAELNALSGAAELQLALLEPDAALATEPRLRELAAAVADPARQRNGELTRLYVLAANGHTRDAATAANTVLDLARRDDDESAQARAQALLARLALAQGDAAAAIEASTQSLAHFPAADDVREEARAGFLHVEALLAGGRAADAARSAADLTAFAAKAGDAASASTPTSRRRARAPTPTRRAPGTRALGEADALRIPADLRDAVTAYATWLIGRGDTGRAGALAERIAGFTARDFDSALLQARVHRALGDAALWRAAVARAQSLAGDRTLPPELVPPAR
jgi:tetratricopeptide (TPR) repeat protein